ncbi:hypothetical protein [Streptomyces mirabilis]
MREHDLTFLAGLQLDVVAAVLGIEVSPVSVAAAKCCNVVGTWPVLTKSTLPPAGSPTFAVGTWISGTVRPSSEPSPTSTLPSSGPPSDAVLCTDPVAVVPVG